MITIKNVLRLFRWFILTLVIGTTLFVLTSSFNSPNSIQITFPARTKLNNSILLSSVRLDERVTSQSYKQTFPMMTNTPPMARQAYDWFDTVLSNSSKVQQWSTDQLDSKLHHLSRWSHLDAQGWRAFVNKTIAKLDPPMSPTNNFTYFELGVGVGAFSRRLLLQYPLAKGVGVDIVQAAIDVARTILPADRMELYSVSNNNYNMIANNTFDHIIAPGVICYLPSLASIEDLMKELVRVAKPGASMCFTMIPFDQSGKFSCNLFILPSFWSANSIISLGLRVTSVQNMSEWNLSHTQNRYAIYLRKELIP